VVSERRYVRAFVALSALQMLPLGLLVPVEILVMQARGLSAAQIGAVVAVVGLTTAALELPTGGLADVVGRRAVLLAGAVVTLLTLVLFATATTFAVFIAAGLLFSVGKALQSGPLESWFVDAVNDLHERGDGRDTVLTRGLGRAGAAAGLALAVGAVAGGLLAEGARRAGAPTDGAAVVLALSVPLLLAAALVVVHIVALLVLMDAHPYPRRGLRAVLGGVGPTVGAAGRLVLTDPVLRWFGLRWLLIPAGFLAFELITPLRLTELLADPATAAAVLGPLLAACYVASALTAPLAPWVRRRVGPLLGAGLATAGAGLGFAVAGLGGGMVVLVAALLVAHLVIGPVNALNGPYLHARVSSDRRATLLSFESLVAHLSVAAGAVLLGVVVEVGGTGPAFVVAGLLTALAALPLIGVARAARREPVPLTVPTGGLGTPGP
jgi:MFS transporter, DHA1 family, tetracycline resistance protein